MKMSTGQIALLAGAGGLVLYGLSKSSPGDPFGFGSILRTVMPNPANEQQRAAYWANRSGGLPSQAGYNGIGATSVQPVFAGALAGLGSFVGNLLRGVSAPGNTANVNRPQSSASSGGGISQPTPGIAAPGIVPGWGGDWSEFGMSAPMEMFEWDTNFDSQPAANYSPATVYGDTSFDPFAGFESES